MCATANAQLGIVKKPGVNLGANFIYAMPQGNFKNAYQFGGGGELFTGVGWGSTYIMASVGITGYKAQTVYPHDITAIPVKAGLKKYFLLKKIFINGDIGVSSLKVNDATSSTFTTGFGGGARLLGLEAALYYNAFKNNGGYSTTGYSNSVQAKIGWSFSL